MLNWVVVSCLILILLEVNAYPIVNSIITDNFVGEIHNISLERIDQDGFNFVNEMLHRYKVLVFRNQSDLTVPGQREFSKYFGTLHVHLESASHYQGYADVNLVSNIKNEEGKYIGLYGKHVELFHSDLSWSKIPSKITILKSVIRPTTCGHTDFLNTVAAYKGLSIEKQALYRNLLGKYCYLNHKNVTQNGENTSDNLTSEEIMAARECSIHPLITKHPITGEYNVYANPSHTYKILLGANPSTDEQIQAKQLLDDLFQHTNQPQFAYTHYWNDDNDVVIWDNRAVQHRATGCPDDFPRKLVRTTINNDDIPRGDVRYIKGSSVWE